MLISAALQAQKEYECVICNYDHNPANKPNTAICSGITNSELLLIFVTANYVPITCCCNDDFYHQLFEI